MSSASRRADEARKDARKAAGAALGVNSQAAATADADKPAPRPAPAPRTPKTASRKVSAAKAPAPPPAEGITHSSTARVRSDQPPGTKLDDGGEVGADQIVRRRTCKDCGFPFGRLQLRPICQSDGACAKRQAKNLANGLQANGQPVTESVTETPAKPEVTPEPEAEAVTNPVLKETSDSPGGEKRRSTRRPRTAKADSSAPAAPAADAQKSAALVRMSESASDMAAAVKAATSQAAAG